MDAIVDIYFAFWQPFCMFQNRLSLPQKPYIILNASGKKCA